MTGLPLLPTTFIDQFTDIRPNEDHSSLALTPVGRFFAARESDFEDWGDSLWAVFPDALPHTNSPAERFAPAWTELLVRAVEEPGLICEAYTRFHGYSLGNRFAALIQCELHGLEPGPLNSFGGWRKLGYAVKEGEKALTLCMPLKGTMHREKPSSEVEANLPGLPPDVEEIEYIRAFTWKPSWFVLSQTIPVNENTPALPIPTPQGWDQTKALQTLNITQVSFQLLDGNALGFARRREIAVSPLSPYPFKTLFHEMAHVVLGHTTDNFRGEGNTGLDLSDGDVLERKLIEVEAESVALMLLATLDLPGQEFCRGYIQHWLSGDEIPEKSAQRIFGAADRILAAGVGEMRPRVPTAEEIGLTEQPSSPFPLSPTPLQSNATLEISVAQQGLPPPATLDAASGLPEPSSDLLGTPTKAIAPEGSNSPKALPLVEPEGQSLHTSLSAKDGTFSASTNERLTKMKGGSATDAWSLYGHLQQVHGELHPTAPELGRSFANGLRYLKAVCPEAAIEVKRLVQGASKQLKTAFEHMEVVLDGSSDWDSSSDFGEFDPFEGMADGEVRRYTSQTSSETGKTVAAGVESVSDPASPTPQPEEVLSPTRQAAARRRVGRSLRSELESERERFLAAAKTHELPVGRKSEKAMLAAISKYLEIPITSRRNLSSHQWARCASAIEADDLGWKVD